jgi:hypothetical protein
MARTARLKQGFGYQGGIPEGTDTAWGCRALVRQDGYVDQVPFRSDITGPRQERLEHVLREHVGTRWRHTASRMLIEGDMNTQVAEDFILYADRHVVVRANTQASRGYLFVCAYLIEDGIDALTAFVAAIAVHAPAAAVAALN